MAERWSDPATQGSPSPSTPRPIPRSSLRAGPRPEEPSRRGPDPLEQGIDRLVSAGRQLVDGVSGARPGSRKAAGSTVAGARRGPRLGELGRWVEDKLEWILEDDDDWREPWQQPRESSRRPPRSPEPAAARPAETLPLAQPSRASSRRRPLEAISRRGPAPAADPDWPAADGDWPDDASFSRPRWQRSPAPAPQSSAPPESAPARPSPPERAASRPLPRSSRRRQS